MSQRKQWFEDLTVGASAEGATGRTLTDHDIVAFDGLSGDFSPLHVDHEYMRSSGAGMPMAHGLLGLALQAGLVGKLFAGAPLAGDGRLASVNWRFAAPTHRGDTLSVRSVVSALEDVDDRTGLVVFDRALVNQHGVVVQSGTIAQKVARRPG